MDDKRVNSDDEIEELEIIEESPENISNGSSPSTNPLKSNSKKSNRKIVDETIDGTGSQMLQNIGVPKNIADKAIKSNGGALSPANNKFIKNRSRNQVASAMDKFGSNKNDSEMLKNRLQRGQGQNLSKVNASNRNREEESEVKNTKDGIQEQVASKTLSTVAQAHGVPKPIADVAASKIADPLLDAMKKKKKIVILSVLAALFIIIVPIIIIASDEDFQESSSESRTKYLYGSGSDEDLYEYLQELGLCNNTESCATIDAAFFYKKLKSVMDSNSYLTQKQADVFIIKMIFYGRDDETAYKQLDEIEYIANIIGKNGYFDISKSNNYKEEFIKEDGYFNTYRQDDLLKNFDTREYKEKLYKKIVQNSKNLISKLVENKEKKNTSLVCSYDVNGKNVSNIKVRLLQCRDDNVGESIAGEELIDFEKYILGVVYAENGGAPTEGLKTQAIAARTYALLRGENMKGVYNLGLEQVNGQWILSIRNCTEDQVYCDPDKGCWSNNASADGTVHSGYDTSKAYARPPLLQDSPIRTAVAETSGKVLVDSNGKMVNTGYIYTDQIAWNEMANIGKDHFEILKATYPTATKINTTCSSASTTGEYTSWKQCDQSWSGIKLGKSSKTICDVGCYITSISIQMAASGTEINAQEFNPGVLVQYLSTSNAFGSDGSLIRFGWNNLAPSFKFYTSVSLGGTIKQKAATIKSYQDQGYYVIIRAKTHQHWVALDRVVGDEVYMFDPASNATSLWDTYPAYDVTSITVFKNG